MSQTKRIAKLSADQEAGVARLHRDLIQAAHQKKTRLKVSEAKALRVAINGIYNLNDWKTPVTIVLPSPISIVLAVELLRSRRSPFNPLARITAAMRAAMSDEPSAFSVHVPESRLRATAQKIITDSVKDQLQRHEIEPFIASCRKDNALKADNSLADKVIYSLNGEWQKVLNDLDDHCTSGFIEKLHDRISQDLPRANLTVIDSIRGDSWAILGRQRAQALLVEFFGSAHLAQQIAYLTIIEDICEVPLSAQGKKLRRILTVLNQNTAYILPFEKVCFVCAKPTQLEVNNRGELHSEGGHASVVCGDGLSCFHWNGHPIPESYVTNPFSITIKKIKETHSERRKRIMIECMGIKRFLDSNSTSEVLDEDFDTHNNKRRLWRARGFGSNVPFVCVEVVNSSPEPDGTHKTYYLQVDDRCRPLLANGRRGEAQNLTCHNAVASTFGLMGKHYRVAAES